MKNLSFFSVPLWWQHMPEEKFGIDFDMTGLREWEQRFPTQVRAGAERGIGEALLLLENAVRTHILEGRPGGHGAAQATGTLVGAVFSEMRSTPQEVRGIVAVHPIAGGYALVIEEGRRPGQKMPPEAPIVAWILAKRAVFAKEVKRISGYIRRGTHGRHAKEVAAIISSDQARQSAAKSMAFVIRRAIGRKGFPGVHMFAKAFGEHTQHVQEIIRAYMVAAVESAEGGAP